MERMDILDLRDLEILILDEADRLLGMGFEKQINSIISHLPKLRRTAVLRLGIQPRQKLLLAFILSILNAKRTRNHHSLYISYEEQLVGDYFGVRYFMTCACVDCWGTVLPCLSCLKSFSLISLHGKIKQCTALLRMIKCLYIEWKELQIGKLGMGYGLLQLPSVPDVKHHSLFTKVFTAVEDINLEEIKYTDKFREKQRKKNLQMKKAAIAQQEEQKTLRLKKEANSTATDMRKKTAKQRRATKLVEDEDEDEITREYPLLKKLKKGVINENEFAKLTGIEDLLSDT
ncbi:hypothetical protein KY290_027742 [Solanum tuberosum]|uniref:DEAD/DEAH-box helicase domain-containing protein n=1 Tax=Solanum tuberosum TaxID=4113 RepID=A0ABQ7UJ66_SOLTU|nr:hypothetical protein KY290_027742 [Solanum tuberosum]